MGPMQGTSAFVIGTRATSAFVIATRDRPTDLVKTVASLSKQTVLPAEVCIVDSSDDTPARAEIEALSPGLLPGAGDHSRD